MDGRDKVAAALDLLKEGLGPLIEQEMQSHFGQDWRRRMPGRRAIPDAYGLLSLLIEYWDAAFRNRLEPFARTLAHDLLNARNRWAHQESFDFDDTYRALDAARRLLEAVAAAEQAAAIRRQTDALWRTRFDEEVARTAGTSTAGVAASMPVSTTAPDQWSAPAPTAPGIIAGPVKRAARVEVTGTPGRPPVRQMLREALDALGDRTTNVAMRDWILGRYPGTNVSTIQAQIIMCTVNHPSRTHYPGNQKKRTADNPRYDFLFRPDRSLLERYVPAQHGVWAISSGLDGRPTIVRVDRHLPAAGGRPSLPTIPPNAPGETEPRRDVPTDTTESTARGLKPGSGALEQRFHGAMLGVYDQARTLCRYTPTRFLQLVGERGGLQAAKYLLVYGDEASSGLLKLWECGRLDISVEALVLDPVWRPLFTDEEIAIARRRLQALGHQRA